MGISTIERSLVCIHIAIPNYTADSNTVISIIRCRVWMPLLALTALALMPAAYGQAWTCRPHMKLEGNNLRKNNKSTAKKLDTLEECQARCEEFEECQSIEYNAAEDGGNRKCHMNTATAAQAPQQVVASTDITWQYCERVTGPQCEFPFTYRGTEYQECTESYIPNGKSWCATVSDFDHVPNPDAHWILC